jgi:hypothetical protein
LPLQTYFLHGSILADGSSGQGPAINPTLLDAQGKWRVSTAAAAAAEKSV